MVTEWLNTESETKSNSDNNNEQETLRKYRCETVRAALWHSQTWQTGVGCIANDSLKVSTSVPRSCLKK
jgi:hypothetical protein